MALKVVGVIQRKIIFACRKRPNLSNRYYVCQMLHLFEAIKATVVVLVRFKKQSTEQPSRARRKHTENFMTFGQY